MALDIYFVNESSALSDIDAYRIAWACDYQAQYHYGRSGWRSDVRCIFVPKAVTPTIPKGSSIMHFLDTSDQQGALGYHDEDGNGIPYGRVFVKTTQQAGDSVSECASHETMELATDPHVNDSCLDSNTNQLWGKEVGDPCQGNAYDIGALQGKKTGIDVADFVLPNFFDTNTKPNVSTDFRGALKGPFTVGPQGYYGYIDLNNPSAGWQQKAGAERTSIPADTDDRLNRR